MVESFGHKHLSTSLFNKHYNLAYSWVAQSLQEKEWQNPGRGGESKEESALSHYISTSNPSPTSLEIR